MFHKLTSSLRKRSFLIGFVLTLVVFIIFFFPLFFSLGKPFGLVDGVSSPFRPQGFYRYDSYLVYFILQHWMHVITTGKWGELATLPDFYGFQHSLFFTDHHLVQAILLLPIFLIINSIVPSVNILILLTMLSSMLSMYVFLYYLTRRIGPSVAGAVVFVLNPFIMARFPEQLILFSLQWIPLMFLCIELWLTRKKPLFLFFLSLLLILQLGTSLYYFVMLTVLLPVYIIVRMRQEKLSARSLLKKESISGAVLLLIGIGITWFLYHSSIGGDTGRGIATSTVYSAWLSDLFFASPQNVLYGGLRQVVLQSAPWVGRIGLYAENSLFPGMVVIILFIVSFVTKKYLARKAVWVAMVTLVFVSLLLSFGPWITIVDHFSIPSPYILLKLFDPMFSYLRVPARFATFLFFGLAVVVSLVLEMVERRSKWGSAIVFGCLLLLLGEYAVRPYQYYSFSSDEKNFYSKLEREADISVLIDIPINNTIPYPDAFARGEEQDGYYLLLASTLHHKKILNGYSGYIPPLYMQRANFLSKDFPTDEQLSTLRQLGVNAVVLHENEYRTSGQFEQAYRGMTRLLGGPKVRESGLALFIL